MYWASLLALLYVVYLVIKPYVVPILASVVITYIFYPMYETFVKYLKSKSVSSFLVATIIVLLVTLPSIFLLNSLSKEAYVIYNLGSQKIATGQIFECTTESSFCEFITSFSDLETRFYLEQALEKITNFTLDTVSSFALSIPSIMLDLFVILFIVYYLLISAPQLREKVYSMVPYQQKHINLILKNLNDVTYAIVYGVFIIGIIEALLGMLGFALIGTSSPVLWGLIIGFLALIPFIGATIVWVPALIIQLYYGILWKAIIILITGIIISTIDTFVKPVFMGDKADLNPAVMLLGILGGLNLFGIVGLFLGPLILSFFVVIFKIYMKEKITS